MLANSLPNHDPIAGPKLGKRNYGQWTDSHPDVGEYVLYARELVREVEKEKGEDVEVGEKWE